MKVHFFTKGDAQAGSSRYRVFLTSQELERLGVETAIYQPPYLTAKGSSFLGKMRARAAYISALVRIPRRDIIYLQRTVYSNSFALIAMLLKVILRKRIVLDFCDPLFLVPELKGRIHFMMRFVDAVITADHFGVEYASRYVKTVFWMPTTVPFRLLSKHTKKYVPKDIPVIGWIGNGRDHMENLKLVAPALRLLLQRGVRFHFRLIGALGEKSVHDLFAIPGLSVEIRDSMDWSDADAIYEEIAAFDVGIVPSIDTEWFRVKVFLKPLEMMGLGVVTVISNVGVTGELIQNGTNGFLAENTPESWADALLRALVLGPEKSQRISDAAVRTIEESHSLEAHTVRLKDFLLRL